MEINILHCVTDEKFIDSMIEMTKVLWQDCCQYYVMISNREGNFRYVHKIEDIINVNKKNFIKYINDNAINAVILHGLASLPYDLIPKINKKILVVWFAWGYDIYMPYRHHPPLIKGISLYHEHTNKVMKMNIKKRMRRFCGYFLYCWQQPDIEKAISRVDYFSGVIPEEYNLITNEHYSFFKAESLVFNYNGMDCPFSEKNIMTPIACGCDIQIGNSADPTNNHIDVFELLSYYSLGTKRIIVPLSYAGTNFYRNKVIECGKELWGDKFIPLNTFIPIRQYNDIMENSIYAIFYHERQQAMGNIFSSLWRGCMVFISKTSPVYTHLKRIGYIFYTIQDDLYRIEANEKMSLESVMTNRKLLIKYHSIDAEEFKSLQILETFRERIDKTRQ